MEETKRHAKELKEHQESSEIHKINRVKDKPTHNPDKRSKHPDGLINKCKFCGGSHQRGKSPAYGKRCHKCQRRNLKHKDRTVNVLFIVIDSDSVPILGLNTFVTFNLIKQVYQISKNIQSTTPIQEAFLDCFGEIGCLPGVHHIDIRDDVKPVIANRNYNKLEQELQRMVNLEIIVTKPTDWVNALVIVSKPNGCPPSLP